MLAAESTPVSTQAAATVVRARDARASPAIERIKVRESLCSDFMEHRFYLGPQHKGRVKCPVMYRIVFLPIIVFNGLFANVAAAATLNCEHLVAVAQTTIALRDQGHTLSSVMAEVERGELQQKLDAQELNLLRQIVRISFTSEYTPREILEACKAGSLGIAKPKP